MKLTTMNFFKKFLQNNITLHSTQSRHKRIGILVFSLSLISYLLSPVFASAATLSLDPVRGSFGPGDMFVMTVRIDTGTDECINASDIDISFPGNLVKVTAVSKGESLMTLWTDGPLIENEKGKVSWSGGIPGGYCGRVLGDPGKTNILGKVVFSVLSPKDATPDVPMLFSFGSSTKVLLNDGFGSVAPLTEKSATITRTLRSSGVKNEWLDIVRADTVPPDQFDVTLHHDQSTLDGKYFVIFSTVDKQSGVDHFEVMEDDPARLGFVRGGNEHASFRTGISPYVLRDQSLKSRVTVRAIDNAGNIEESILPPSAGTFATNVANDTGSISSQYQDVWWFILIALFAVILAFAYWYHHNVRLKKDTETDIHVQQPPEQN